MTVDYKNVPMVPTPEMIKAGILAKDVSGLTLEESGEHEKREEIQDIWIAMVASKPVGEELLMYFSKKASDSFVISTFFFESVSLSIC